MVELELGPLRFGVVGAGRLGTVLATALQRCDFELVAASCATSAGCERASHALGIPVFSQVDAVVDGVDVVLLCVPDDALDEVVAELAEKAADRLAGVRVVHTAGSRSVDVLAPLAAAGADVLALHPLQTVTHASTPDDLRGAAAAITAGDDATRTFGSALAHAVGLAPFELADEVRPLYHAASSFAANFTVTMLAAARDICEAAGVDQHVARHAFAGLARAAAMRVEREGPEAALTGPIARGDVTTVRRHVEALEAAVPETAPLYRAAAAATVRLAVLGGQLGIERSTQLSDVVGRVDATAGRGKAS